MTISVIGERESAFSETSNYCIAMKLVDVGVLRIDNVDPFRLATIEPVCFGPCLTHWPLASQVSLQTALARPSYKPRHLVHAVCILRINLSV